MTALVRAEAFTGLLDEMNDTTRRFLTGILQRVSETHVVDVRLFPPIRQGGIESGVAVLAVEPGFDVPSSDATPQADGGLEPTVADAELAAESVGSPSDLEAEGLPLEREVPIDADGMVSLAEVVVAELERERDRGPDDVATAEIVADLADAPTEDMAVAPDLVDGPADVAAPADERDETVALGDILALPSPEGRPSRRRVDRLAILCARYKLVFKGPERGTWSLEISHHADAPLDALERVIAGVVRRAGDATEPVRYDARSLRDALDAPAWAEGPVG
jgi:hypothetical protein